MKKIGVPGTEEFNRKNESELAWVASAHSAVAEGYEVYTALLDDRSQVAYAAANDRIHSRYCGLGTVIEVTPREYDVELVLDFDEEGRKPLGIDNSPLRYLADSVRYLWGKFTSSRIGRPHVASPEYLEESVFFVRMEGRRVPKRSRQETRSLPAVVNLSPQRSVPPPDDSQ